MSDLTLKLKTNLGSLFQGDCIEVMRDLPSESVDLIFADPPFNIGKSYKSGINDSLPGDQYVSWTEEWIKEATRILKDGGSIFVYNIPKWNIESARILNNLGLEFRHWIAIDMPNGLPIKGRLYPSHYSLLYYSKGKPRVFAPPRTAIEKCRHCNGDVKDYGGHRNKLNPQGLNLKDVWTDIGKVTGKKNRNANELPLKLLDRVLDISSVEEDLILDPFAGSGTTLIAAELKNRRWIGIELDDCSDIVNRLENIGDDKRRMDLIQSKKNTLE